MVIELGMPVPRELRAIDQKIHSTELIEVRRYEGDHLCYWQNITADCDDVVDVLVGDDLPADEAVMLRNLMQRLNDMGAVQVKRVHCTTPNDLVYGAKLLTYMRYYRQGAGYN